MVRNWKSWLTRVLLVALGPPNHLAFLAFRPGGPGPGPPDSPNGTWARAIRPEDPLYPWAKALSAVIPPDATYVFLDNYEAGKEIEVRYFLAPRRHILLAPEAPAPFLFYTLHQEQASFLLIRDRDQAPGAGGPGGPPVRSAGAAGPPGPGSGLPGGLHPPPLGLL